MRHRWQNFQQGLWITGPREDNPQGTLRRAKGVAPLRSVALRSRSGTLGYFSLDAHSMTRFDDEYLIGAGVDLYVSVNRAIGSESVVGSAPSGGPGPQDGTRLTFVQMPPTAGFPDQVFIAGGGTLVKKADSSIGGPPTFWGITPPDYTDSDGLGADTTLALATQQVLTIDNMEDIADSSTWTETGDDIDTLQNNTNRFTQGTASMRFEALKDKSVEATRNFGAVGDPFNPTVDFTTFGGGIPSQLEDFISFDVRVNRPKHIKSISISFAVGTVIVGQNLFDKAFSRDLKVQVVRRAVRKRLIGTGDLVKGTRIKSAQREKDFITENVDQLRDRSQAEFVAQDTIAVVRRRWTRVNIPKSSFEPSGGVGDADWATVRAVRLTVETNKLGRANVNFDNLRMIGGTGMLGDYQYHFTFLNEDTGTRSNPDLTTGPLTIEDVERQGVTITNIPQVPNGATDEDPQVTHVEIWRTMGNGSVFFLAKTVDIGVTSTTDTVADYVGLAEGAAAVLDTEVLPFDNIKPENTYEDAAGPHLARMWWGRDTAAGTGGRLYFSPVGRAEAVEGFIEVGTDEDQIQKLVIFDQRLYVFTQKHVYLVTGNDISTFQAVEIFGAPGTLQPFTCVPTPGGIVYRAFDGIRVFDGTTSRLAANDAIAPILRNSSTDGLTDFVGDYAAFGRGEYYITDSRDVTNTTLALDSQQGTWRNIGFPSNFLFFDSEANILFGGNIPEAIGGALITRLTTSVAAFTVAAANPFVMMGTCSSPAIGLAAIGDAQFRAPRDMTITRIYVRLNAALTGTQVLTCRANVGGVADSDITVTHNVSTGTLAFDTGAVLVDQDDLVCLQFDFSGGLTTTSVRSVAVAYEIIPE